MKYFITQFAELRTQLTEKLHVIIRIKFLKN